MVDGTLGLVEHRDGEVFQRDAADAGIVDHELVAPDAISTCPRAGFQVGRDRVDCPFFGSYSELAKDCTVGEE